MALRVKWEVEVKRRGMFVDGKSDINNTEKGDGNGNGNSIKTQLLDLIDSDGLTCHFQPIYSLSSSSIYGYEALARIRQPERLPNIKNIYEMFVNAKDYGILSLLDITCCLNALKIFSGQNNNQNHYLFINLSPETICDRAFGAEISEEILKNINLNKQNIVFEITEESMVYNLAHFTHNIHLLKKYGFKIAIDDFGAGFGGLKMLSIVEPDFVKIDRHFISNLDKAIVKYNIIDSIAIACNRMGIKIIAEGVERKEEIDTLALMNIDLFQGYYLSKPVPLLKDITINDGISLTKESLLSNQDIETNAEVKCIGNIATRMNGLSSDTPVKTIVSRLIDDPDIRCQPIVDADSIVGMVYRSRFIENQVVGKCGYGMHLNHHKKIKQVMEKNFTIVEYNEPLEDVSIKIQKRDHQNLYDEIAVTKNGKYYGIVSISTLLDAITQKSLILAKGSNPLTGLPGNEAIQREIEKRITQNIHFDVAYFDLNNFKPFNDYYGFAMGDYVIRSLADIISDVRNEFPSNDIFIGHIGGDDFILISHPSMSINICSRIVEIFEQKQIEYHGIKDYEAGCYITQNRKGDVETFRLLSLSVGIVSTEVYKIDSFAQLASLASEVKKAAKQESNRIGRSAIFRDRRLLG